MAQQHPSCALSAVQPLPAALPNLPLWKFQQDPGAAAASVRVMALAQPLANAASTYSLIAQREALAGPSPAEGLPHSSQPGPSTVATMVLGRDQMHMKAPLCSLQVCAEWQLSLQCLLHEFLQKAPVEQLSKGA